MAELRALRQHLGGVRVRITVLATVVTGIAVLLAGAWLVHGVQGSLTDAVRDADRRQLTMVANRVEAGQPLNDVLIGSATAEAGAPSYLQAVIDGRVVAANDAAKDLGPLADGGTYANVYQTGSSDALGSAGTRAIAQPATGKLAVTSMAATSPSGPVELIAASPLDDVERSVAAVRHGLLFALPGLVAAVGGLTWFLTGRALRPVEGIRREVEAISGSTLARRVPVPASGDEVSRLATTMNAMLDRIESASTRQQQFVADASHELRSPVATIRTELEVARLVDDAEAWPAVVHRLLGEEARLEAVITDLLLLATLDEGAPLPEATVVDLAAEVRAEVARRAASAASVPGPTVVVEAPGPAEVRGSASQLRRIAVNLIDNAARHAAGEVRVSVASADRSDGEVELVVDDDGPGISPADRERVFDRFTRLDGHRARSSEGAGGAGLGLSLVRSIAARHGGTVRAETSPTGGARLVVVLPGAVARPGEPADQGA